VKVLGEDCTAVEGQGIAQEDPSTNMPEQLKEGLFGDRRNGLKCSIMAKL
jgi:hypothetical protein